MDIFVKLSFKTEHLNNFYSEIVRKNACYFNAGGSFKRLTNIQEFARITLPDISGNRSGDVIGGRRDVVLKDTT